MKTILLLLVAASASMFLTSCDILGQDERNWATQTAAFNAASQYRHQAYSERMANISRMGGER